MHISGQEKVSLIFATLSALFFGSCAPVTKLFVSGTEPLMLASLFYLGSGIGMFCLVMIRWLYRRGEPPSDAPVSRHDLPFLAGMSLFGGILAPVVLMYSMQVTPAATGSLLLNFEPVATGVMAAFLFHESVGKRIWTAMILITLSCILLSYDPGIASGFSIGAMGVLVACVFWGVDNNISRRVSGRDPFVCIMVKGLSAGICTGLIALGIGETAPPLFHLPFYLLIGFFSFGGLASVFFLLALRSLGTARTGLFLALSPFFGVFFSFVLFRDPFQRLFVPAFLIMAGGVYLLVTERHSHAHSHPPLVHDHRHTHGDLHHDHPHGPNSPPVSSSGEHSHLHAHVEITHEHPHKPDLHHQHDHP